MSVSIEKIINSWQVTKYDLHILTLNFTVPLFIIFLKFYGNWDLNKKEKMILIYLIVNYYHSTIPECNIGACGVHWTKMVSLTHNIEPLNFIDLGFKAVN